MLPSMVFTCPNVKDTPEATESDVPAPMFRKSNEDAAPATYREESLRVRDSASTGTLLVSTERPVMFKSLAISRAAEVSAGLNV